MDTSLSDYNVLVSAKLVNMSGSHDRAACLVPALLSASSPARICDLMIT